MRRGRERVRDLALERRTAGERPSCRKGPAGRGFRGPRKCAAHVDTTFERHEVRPECGGRRARRDHGGSWRPTGDRAREVASAPSNRRRRSSAIAAKYVLIASLVVNVLMFAAIAYFEEPFRVSAISRPEGNGSRGSHVRRVHIGPPTRLSMTTPRGLKGEKLERRWRRDVGAKLRTLLNTTHPASRGQLDPWPDDTVGYALWRATFPSPSGIDNVVMYRLLPQESPASKRKPAVVLAIPEPGPMPSTASSVESPTISARQPWRWQTGYAKCTRPRALNRERSSTRAGSRHADIIRSIYSACTGSFRARTWRASSSGPLPRRYESSSKTPRSASQKIATFGISRGGSLSALTAAR